MNILYQEIVEYCPYANIITIPSLIIAVTILVIFGIYLCDVKERNYLGIFFIFLSIVLLFSGIFAVLQQQVKGYKYYVSIDDDHTIDEYLDGYRYIESKGKIYILWKEK